MSRASLARSNDRLICYASSSGIPYTIFIFPTSFASFFRNGAIRRAAVRLKIKLSTALAKIGLLSISTRDQVSQINCQKKSAPRQQAKILKKT